jgi:hypothetical protein
VFEHYAEPVSNKTEFKSIKELSDYADKINNKDKFKGIPAAIANEWPNNDGPTYNHMPPEMGGYDEGTTIRC